VATCGELGYAESSENGLVR
jgi:hypothetical protein